MSSSANMYLRGVGGSALGILIISPDGLFIRLVEGADAYQIVFYRMLFLGSALAISLLAFYRKRLMTALRGLGWRGLLAGVLMAATNFGFVTAMLNTTIANVVVILAITPFFGAVFSRLLLGERVCAYTWAAIMLGFAGVAIMVWGAVSAGDLLGNLIALSSAAAQGLNLTLLRGLGNRDTSPTICLSGFLAAGVAACVVESFTIPAHDLAIIAFQGWIQLPLAITLFIAGARFAPAPEVALLILLETTLGPLWAWIGVGEVPSAETFFGGVFVMSAIVLNSAGSLYMRSARAGAAKADQV